MSSILRHLSSLTESGHASIHFRKLRIRGILLGQGIGMRANTKDTVLSLLRWIAFLPAAAVTAFLAHAVFQLVVIVFRQPTIPFLDELTANGLAGFVFVLVGAKVAPARRMIVSLVLVILFAVLSGWAAVGLAMMDDRIGLVGLVAGLIGAGLGFYGGSGLYREHEARRARRALRRVEDS